MAFAARLGNFLYNATFTLCFLLTTLMVAASCTSIVFQARLASKDVANWNVLVVVGSYVALGIIAAIIFISRRHTGLKRLKTIPKPYIAVKKGDVPQVVSDLIIEEYTRSCIAVAVSRPKKGTHPGWGAPDSNYPGMHFRTAILDTIGEIDKLARTFLPELPPLRPHRPMIGHLKRLDFVLLQDDHSRLRDYDGLVQRARFDVDEPTQEDWERCEEIVEQMKTILQFYIRAEAGGTTPTDEAAYASQTLGGSYYSAKSSPAPQY